ncbi:MAG: LysR substrate-binding domain-containing protein [Burkholderiaceae bacterium]|nr:LysR substrate-binding domain-containing protein [Burkholderiaceae bacterium]
MNVTLRQLQAFRAVAELGSFREAAARLHLSQPALSAAVRKLEFVLDVRLFDRTTRRLALTAEGQELLRLASRLIEEFDAVTGNLRDYLARRRGRVVVAALPSLAALTLPRALARLKRLHPGIDVAIRDTLHDEIQELVESGRADFGLTVAPADERCFSFAPMLVDRFVMLCRHDHPLARRRSISWQQMLKSSPMVSMSRTSSVRQHIEAACAQAGIDARGGYDAAHLATVGALVREGLGVAALPSSTTPLLAFAGLAEVPLHSPRIERTMGMIRRAGRSPSVAAQALIELLAGPHPIASTLRSMRGRRQGL